MKKLMYLCLLLSFSNLSKAQVPDTAPWCPDGATWVYRQFAMSSIVYNVYEFQKDTMINGFNSKEIRDRVINIFPPTPINPNYYRLSGDTNYLYLRESNDSVFILKNNEFKFMYDFSAVVGDQFIVNDYVNYLTCQSQDQSIFIDDTLTLTQIDPNYTVDNYIFKRSFFSSKGRWGIGSLINKIGGDQSFFPMPSQNDCFSQIGFSGLHCYSDFIRGTILFNSGSAEIYDQCDYITSSLFEKDEIFSSINKPIVYPNPTTDYFSIQFAKSIESVDFEIMDISGRIIKTVKKSTLKNIDVTQLQTGTYLINIKLENNNHLIKFIKQ